MRWNPRKKCQLIIGGRGACATSCIPIGQRLRCWNFIGWDQMTHAQQAEFWLAEMAHALGNAFWLVNWDAFKSLAKIPAERPAILYNKSADKGFFFYWQAPCPYILLFLSVYSILYVNLGHRSPRGMSWGTCVGWSVWLLGHILTCLLCSCRDLNLQPLERRLC